MKFFLIPSLFAAGLGSNIDDAENTVKENKAIENPDEQASILNYRLPFVLAGHSSHSSHASHGSHGSHRSSSTGSNPSYSSPSPSTPGNSTTPEGILPKIKPNSADYSALVLEIQTCLQIFNYYFGPLDGILGSKTKQAIAEAQKQNNMTVTGTLDMEFIKRCRVSLKN